MAEDGEDNLKVKSIMGENGVLESMGDKKVAVLFQQQSPVWGVLRVTSIRGPGKALSETQSISKFSLNINPQIPSYFSSGGIRVNAVKKKPVRRGEMLVSETRALYLFNQLGRRRGFRE